MVLTKLLKTLDAKHLKFHYVCGRIPLFFFVKLILLLDSILFCPPKGNSRIFKAKTSHRIKDINSPSAVGFTS